MAITLRLQKGSKLSFSEMDENFSDLDERSALSYTIDSDNELQYVSGTYDFGNNIIKYANAVDQESDLANYDPGDYHGMTMHVHSTGGLYYAHAGVWRKLLTDTSYNNVEGAGYVSPLSDVAYDGDYNSLANTPSIPSALTDLGISDGTNGQILSTDGLGNFSFVDDADGASSLDDLTDVSVSGATSGQILKYDGTNWIPATDLTADSGSGITLNDLSVSVQTAGSANLAYDNTSGVFSYTPPDLSSYALASSVPNTLLDLSINDGTNGQVLSTDGSGNFSFISVTSGDPDQNLFATVVADSGATTANTTTDILTISGGTDISTSISGDTLTLSYTGSSGGDPDQNLFATITADSGSTTADTTTDVLTISGGTDISTSISGDTLTLNYTGSSGATNFDELGDVSSAGIDVNDIYEAAIVTLRVDNNSSIAYTFDSHYSGDNPTIYAISGTTIAFDLDLIGGHPFELQDGTGTALTTGLVHVSAIGTVSTGSAAQGFDSGTLYWRIQESLSGNYQYQCQLHSGMNGTITIKRLSTL